MTKYCSMILTHNILKDISSLRPYFMNYVILIIGYNIISVIKTYGLFDYVLFFKLYL